MKSHEEKIVAWLKYTDHDGNTPTTIEITEPDDEEAFPVYRDGACSIRSCNCTRLGEEVERLKNELKASEFFLNEKREIIDHMKREYEELEFEFNQFKKDAGLINIDNTKGGVICV